MNRTGQYQFTIVVPVFNEEDNMPNLEKALADFLPKSLYKACVLFVNDGSRDDSLLKIKEIIQKHMIFI